MQERVVSDLNSYVKGVFLYLDATLSAAEGDSIRKINSANGFNAYKFDFANIHNSWYNYDLGDFFNDDNCSTESGCRDYNWDDKVCREICTDINIKCSQEEVILFNNIPELISLIEELLNNKKYCSTLLQEIYENFRYSEKSIEKSLDKICNILN